MVDVNNTINRFTLDELNEQIFVREIIESSIGCRISWSKKTANQFITVYNEGSNSWKHTLTQVSGNRSLIYVLDSFKDGHLEFHKSSDQISEIYDLWRVAESNFIFIPSLSGVTLCAEGRRAVNLIDSDGEFLSITHAAQKNLSTTESFSIVVWAMINDQSKKRYIVRKDGNYNIYYDNSTDRIRFELTTTGGTEAVVAETYGDVPLSTWMFIQAWYDADNAEMRINVNRADLNTDADVNDNLLTIVPGSEDFLVGKNWEGRIDKLAFFSKVVDDALADRLYNDGVGVAYTKIPRDALVSYWEMNEEFGTRYDSTGRLNHLSENTNTTEFFGEGILSTSGVGA